MTKEDRRRIIGREEIGREQFLCWRTRWRRSKHDLDSAIKELKAEIRKPTNDHATVSRAQSQLDILKSAAHSMILARTLVDSYRPDPVVADAA